MALIKRKIRENNVSEKSIRDTYKWKSTYSKFADEIRFFKTEEHYKKHIDKIVTTHWNNNNILNSWNKFKSEDFDIQFRTKVAEFGSEEKYYQWLDKEKEKYEAKSAEEYNKIISQKKGD